MKANFNYFFRGDWARPLAVIVLLVVPQFANAGFTEVSASGNYRQTYINPTNYSVLQSITGSVSYYFWEMSALELSYTNGISRNITDEYTSSASFELYGLDFIWSFGGKDDRFKPYVKVGGAYQNKRLVYTQQYYNPVTDTAAGPCPSAGVGFRLGLSESFGIKAGLESWTSPVNSGQPLTYDIAARAGISWMF